MTHIVVDKSTDNAKPHSIDFLPQRNFFTAQAEKGIARHWREHNRVSLIDNGKLANRIARLEVIIVKLFIFKFVFFLFVRLYFKYVYQLINQKL